MNESFSQSTLGKSGIPVHRLGFSASYKPGKETIYAALDKGVNLFYAYSRHKLLLDTLRDVMKSNREKYVTCMGASNYMLFHANIRKSLEKHLRKLKTDYIDVFLFLGVMREKEFPESVRDELYQLREEGKVKTIGLSTHNRKFAGKLVADGAIDVAMVRYNAAHRGAEEDIFPHLENHDPGVISYTATRWRYLLKPPKNWPKNEQVPSAAMCYRFVLSNPHVDVCLTAPANLAQFEENISSLEQGPLNDEEMAFMRKFGDAVHHTKKWFM
jgi:aryl-alcohol dehydrogenase-like predicted oxidoreductase